MTPEAGTDIRAVCPLGGFMVFLQTVRRRGLSALSALSCTTGLICATSLTTPTQAGAATAKAQPAAHKPVSHKAAAYPRTGGSIPMKGAPQTVRGRPTQVEAHDTESVNVNVSRHAREGGGGMMRAETAPHNVQTISKAYIAMQSPTSTALDLAKLSPSLNAVNADSSGMQGGAIETRSLTDLDMGLMLNGAPTTNANYLNETADSEDVESVTISPGSSSIDLPTTSAAAGVLDERTHTPEEKAGGMMDFSYGTNNLSREFIRLESGDIGHSGFRNYISYSHTHARSWMGSGINERHHLDYGLQKNWENGSQNNLFLSWNYEDFTIDVYPTAEQFKTYKHTGEGYGRDAQYNSTSANAGNYWKNNIDHWNQLFISAPQHFVITPRITFDLTPYFNLGRGWDGSDGGKATSGEYYFYNGTPVADGAQLTSYYHQYADTIIGDVAKIGIDIDRHNHFTLGYWYENNDSIFALPTSVTMLNGENPSPNSQLYQAFVKMSDGSLQHATGVIDGGYELHSLFIGDTAKYLNDRLVVDAGFKYVMSNYWEKSNFYGSHSRLSENSTAPLPHLSIGYHFNDHHQIYVNAEGDFRQPDPTSLVGNSSGQLQKNQYSIKEEIGYRYNGDIFIADLSFFNYAITNRLLSTYVGANQTGTINAGNQTARGFDMQVSTRPWHHVSPFFGFEYLDAHMDSNVPYLNSYLPTKGKQAVMAPHVSASFNLAYDDSRFFGNVGIKYIGPQSVTLVGDERMPGFVSDSISVGYHFKPFGFLKSPTFRLNFNNITGSIVRTLPKGIATNLNATTLLNGTDVAAATSGAQFYVMPRFNMTGTVSTAF